MATGANGEQPHDPGTRLILGELRDLRIEMRADRQRADEERRQADAAWREERRRVDEERQRADEAWLEERRLADAAWREERRQADARFDRIMQDFREDSARRAAETQEIIKNIRTVGVAIVKTLNRHTRILERHEQILERIERTLDRHGQILERIERTLVAWATGRLAQGNGGDAPAVS